MYSIPIHSVAVALTGRADINKMTARTKRIIQRGCKTVRHVEAHSTQLPCHSYSVDRHDWSYCCCCCILSIWRSAASIFVNDSSWEVSLESCGIASGRIV